MRTTEPGGIATDGYVIRDDAGTAVARKSSVIGEGPKMSNNVAEYAALCECLVFPQGRKMVGADIEVTSDSKLVVNQMAGEWEFHGGLYAEKYLEAKHLAAKFAQLAFRWIPKEQNEEADALSREAYERALSDSP